MSERRLTARLASPRLAAWLIGALIVMAVVNVVVPQRTYLPAQQFEDFRRSLPALAAVLASLGLDAVFGGWLMAGVSGLLLVNLTLCTARRVRAHRIAPRAAAPRSASRVALGAGPSSGVIDRAAGALAARGWRAASHDERGLVVRKNAHSFWGSVLLHAGIGVVIVGGALSALGGFAGTMLLAEGQSVIDTRGAYLSVERLPRVGRAYTSATLGLERMDVRYEGGQVVSAVARMTAAEPRGVERRRDVHVNYPLDVAGKSYLLQENGYALALGLARPGAEEEAMAVNLARPTPSGWADSLVVAAATGGQMTIELTATAEPVTDPSRAVTDKLDAEDPRLVVEARRADGRTVRGELATGEELRLPDGSVLRFADLRLWARFLVRGQPFRWIVYLGFWLAVAGAVWRFAFPELRVNVVLTRDAGLAVAWTAKPWSPQGRSGRQAVLDTLAGAVGDREEETA